MYSMRLVLRLVGDELLTVPRELASSTEAPYTPRSAPRARDSLAGFWRCARGCSHLRRAPMPPRSEARSEAATDDGVPLAARRAVADGDIEAGATQPRSAAEAYKVRRRAAEALPCETSI